MPLTTCLACKCPLQRVRPSHAITGGAACDGRASGLPEDVDDGGGALAAGVTRCGAARELPTPGLGLCMVLSMHVLITTPSLPTGAALLASFLRPEIAAALAHAALAADRRDGLDCGEMPPTGPPYAAGTRRPGWRLLGPPQLRRYLRYRPRPITTAAEVGGHGAEGEGGGTRSPRRPCGVGAQLEAVRQVMSPDEP